MIERISSLGLTLQSGNIIEKAMVLELHLFIVDLITESLIMEGKLFPLTENILSILLLPYSAKGKLLCTASGVNCVFECVCVCIYILYIQLIWLHQNQLLETQNHKPCCLSA